MVAPSVSKVYAFTLCDRSLARFRRASPYAFDPSLMIFGCWWICPKNAAAIALLAETSVRDWTSALGAGCSNQLTALETLPPEQSLWNVKERHTSSRKADKSSSWMTFSAGRKPWGGWASSGSRAWYLVRYISSLKRERRWASRS